MQFSINLTSVLCISLFIASISCDLIPCAPLADDANVHWYREEPLYMTKDLQIVYQAERKNKYDGHDYTISASVDIASNVYIKCISPNGNGRQFKVSFKDVNNNILGSYWIQKDVECVLSQQTFKRSDVKSISTHERKY